MHLDRIAVIKTMPLIAGGELRLPITQGNSQKNRARPVPGVFFI